MLFKKLMIEMCNSNKLLLLFQLKSCPIIFGLVGETPKLTPVLNTVAPNRKATTDRHDAGKILSTRSAVNPWLDLLFAIAAVTSDLEQAKGALGVGWSGIFRHIHVLPKHYILGVAPASHSQYLQYCG